MALYVVKLSQQNSITYRQEAWDKTDAKGKVIRSYEAKDQTLYFDKSKLDKKGEAEATRLIATNTEQTLGIMWKRDRPTV